MKLNLQYTPPPLTFFAGTADEFTLHLRVFNGYDRTRVLDGLRPTRERPAGSLEEFAFAIQSLVIGWSGVMDAAGNPVPFEVEENSNPKCNLPALLGALKASQQFHVYASLMAFIGLPAQELLEMAQAFGVKEDELRPTTTQGGDTPAPASKE